MRFAQIILLFIMLVFVASYGILLAQGTGRTRAMLSEAEFEEIKKTRAAIVQFLEEKGQIIRGAVAKGDFQQAEELLGPLVEHCLQYCNSQYLLEGLAQEYVAPELFESYYKIKLLEYSTVPCWFETNETIDFPYLEKKIREQSDWNATTIQLDKDDAKLLQRIDAFLLPGFSRKDKWDKHEVTKMAIGFLEETKKIKCARIRNEYVTRLGRRFLFDQDLENARLAYEMLDDPLYRDRHNVTLLEILAFNNRKDGLTPERFEILAGLPEIRCPVYRVYAALRCLQMADTLLSEENTSFCAYQAALLGYTLRTAKAIPDKYLRAYSLYLIYFYSEGILFQDEDVEELLFRSIERLEEEEKKSFYANFGLVNKRRMANRHSDNEEEESYIEKISRIRRERSEGINTVFDELRTLYRYVTYLTQQGRVDRRTLAVDELNETLFEHKYTNDLRKAADINVALGRYDDAIKLLNLIVPNSYRDSGYCEFISASLLKGDRKQAEKLTLELSDESLRKRVLSSVAGPKNKNAPWQGIGGYSQKGD